LQKATISFVMSAPPSVRRLSACSDSAPKGRIFGENRHLSIFRKPIE